MKFELHPLASLFPRMAGADFEALKADIEANGLRHAIVTHQGMILDGGNRYQACMDLGIKPMMVEYTGDNLVTYVLSANFYRRHLSAGQQAAIVASATDWAKAQTHGGGRLGDQGATVHLETVAQRAAVSGASPRTQKTADKLVREQPALAQQVVKGEKSLNQAAKEAKPAKAPKAARFDPPPPPESDPGDDAVQILSEENDRLNDRLAVVAMHGTDEERRAAEETITQLRAMVKTLTVELDAVKASRDSLMSENGELKKQLASQRKALAKLKA